MKKLAILMALMYGTAQAATATLSVSGTIATTCNFGSPSTGTFGFDPATPTTLNTLLTGGNPAQVTVTYNGTPTVTVTEVTSFSVAPNGFSGTPTFYNTLTHSNGGTLTYTSGLASYTQTGGTTDTFTLNLRAVNGSAFPLGTYTGAATITCN